MRAHQASCDCGYKSKPFQQARNAWAALRAHSCPQHRCANCGGLFWVLVDDGDLCLRCDSLFYPWAA